MIRIVICDDDPCFAATLTDELTALAAKYEGDLDLKIGPTFTSPELVLSFMEQMDFDIIFLDIDMPKITGFDLAAKISEKDPKALIIFVSAYDNYVYQSFAYSPFRFLRKLHLKEELPSAFDKAIEKCLSETQALSFNSTEGNITLRPSDILYFENDKNYYNIYCENGAIYKCRGTIKALESICTDKRFFKIHSAYIINLEHVSETHSSSAVTMKDGTVLSVAAPRRSEFKETYMKFVRRRYSR